MPRLLPIFALSLIPLAARGDDWPQWMGPKRDAVWREDGILDKFPKDFASRVRWRQPIGPGYAGAAVVGDRVYVMDRETDKPSLKDDFARAAMPGKERVLSLDTKTGKEVWHHSYDCPYIKLSYPNGPRTTPAVDNGKVYTLGALGHLFCLNAADGKVIWQKELNKAYPSDHPIWGHAASVLIDGKKLITLAGGVGSAVVALDKETGKEIWKSLYSKEVCYVPPIIVEAGGARQLIIWLSDTLNSLDPETGKENWMIPYMKEPMAGQPAVNIAQPRVIGDNLFVSSFYLGSLAVKLAKDKPAAEELYRSKKTTKPEKADTLHALMSTPGEKDGYLYASGAMGEIQCIEAATGKRLWSDNKPFGKDALFGTIFFIRNGERWFLFTDAGDLILANLSPKGYEEIDRVHIIDPSQSARKRDVVWCHPAFAGKCLYVRNDKEIICVDLAK